jgi:predicted exporter
MEMTAMARRKRLLVPEAQAAVKQLKNRVMADQGYAIDAAQPDNVKYEVAKEINVPLKKGYNGTLTSKQAGEVGGKIGGSMVKEMIRMAQQNLSKP